MDQNNVQMNNQYNNVSNNSPKKVNTGCLIGGIVGVLFVAIILIIFITTFFGDDGDEDKKTDNSITNTEQQEEENDACEANNEALSGLKGKNIDYYYNIDTSKFDKSIFNGQINFHGITVDGKITTNKLKNLGVKVNQKYYETNYIAFKANDEGIYCSTTNFSIDTSMDIINNDVQINDMSDYALLVCDYTGGNELYSDNTLLTYGGFTWNLSGRNIYPVQLGISSYGDITIDLVLEKLGNPTYVVDRDDPCLSTIYSYTTYIYVYDEVAFLYSFYNWSNLKLASVYYYPIDDLNGKNPTKITYNDNEYDNYIDYWNQVQKDYLKKK